VPKLDPVDIQRTIDGKHAKLKRYRERVSEVWLLIAADGFDCSNTWSISDEIFKHPFVTQFDGVVLLEDAMNRATRLS
jgi:hypothetical protein